MKKIQKCYKIFVIIFISCVASMTILYLIAYISPKIKINSTNAVYIYDNKNNLIFQTNDNKNWANLNEISENLKKATISVEDKNFYTHNGFDYLRIIKAMFLNIKNKSIVEGASTISQQYVKNLYLDFNQTWKRKIQEAYLTLNLEVHYSKGQILEGYLNTINYGQGNYGIENASEYYFNKKSKDLTLEESLMLAGIPKSPENYNPVSNYDACVKRAKIVAKTMIKNNYITKKQYNKLFKKAINIYGKKETNNMTTFMYYYDAIMKELNQNDNLPKSLIESGGLKIYTTLDLDTQKKLDEEIINNYDGDDTQIASIATNPKTGGILALTGGVNYAKSQYNRVTQSKRHVGSTIKPFLYYSALKNNMTEASTFKSEKTNFVFSDNQTYSPNNYSDTYANKNITMAAAIAYSDNIYAVKTHLFLGENEIIKTLKAAGLKETLNPIPSLALGAQEINMLDYAGAYNTLANYGTHNDLYCIEKVENVEGKVLYTHQQNSQDVLEKNYVFIVNEMLTNTYNPAFIDYLSPTVIYLNSKISRKYSLKSGTTNNDYWIVGYNPDILMMVWAGNDQNKKVDSKYSRKIKNIWVNTVENYEKDKKESWYTIPDDVIGIPLNAITGEYDLKSKNSTIFYFVKGSEPEENKAS
jgi:penicillin-binding protein 2D